MVPIKLFNITLLVPYTLKDFIAVILVNYTELVVIVRVAIKTLDMLSLKMLLLLMLVF